jgi:proteasome lid subunit RPN8/RPN11
MTILIPAEILDEIRAHGQRHYPEEGAGLILGHAEGERRTATTVQFTRNHSDPDTRRRRYLIDPLDMLAAERMAEANELEVIGVFHSHPDHPAEPSEFDLVMALPWYSYLITRVAAGIASETRAWRLDEDRGAMIEESLQIIKDPSMEAKI